MNGAFLPCFFIILSINFLLSIFIVFSNRAFDNQLQLLNKQTNNLIIEQNELIFEYENLKSQKIIKQISENVK